MNSNSKEIKNIITNKVEMRTISLCSEVSDLKKNSLATNVKLTQLGMSIDRIEEYFEKLDKKIDRIGGVLYPDDEVGDIGLVQEHKKMYRDYVWIIRNFQFLGLATIGGWVAAITAILKSFGLL